METLQKSCVLPVPSSSHLRSFTFLPVAPRPRVRVVLYTAWPPSLKQRFLRLPQSPFPRGLSRRLVHRHDLGNRVEDKFLVVLRLALVGQHTDTGCLVWIVDCDLHSFQRLFPLPDLEVARFLGADNDVDLAVGLLVASLEPTLHSPPEDLSLEALEAREMVSDIDARCASSLCCRDWGDGGFGFYPRRTPREYPGRMHTVSIPYTE